MQIVSFNLYRGLDRARLLKSRQLPYAFLDVRPYDDRELILWVEENCSGVVYRIYNGINDYDWMEWHFEKASDAIFFKLRWSDYFRS